MTLDKKKAEANHEKSKLMTHAKIQTTGNSAELSESERRQLRKLEEVVAFCLQWGLLAMMIQ